MKTPYSFTLLLLLVLQVLRCSSDSGNLPPSLHRIPGIFVYCILEHNDSLYFSTQNGEVCRFQLNNRDSLTRMGKKRFHPLRSLVFRDNGPLLASSYETGVHIVTDDTLTALPKLYQAAWAMTKDSFGNIWLAGRHGVYREIGDSLQRITSLSEAYDVDFYNGYLAVAHRRGVSLYDTASGDLDTTFCRSAIFWTLDRFDSLLVAGGVETCLLISEHCYRKLNLPSAHATPWDATQDSSGIIYLGTQKGLYALSPPRYHPKCIAYKDTCIKSVLIDSKNRLWVGEYFTQASDASVK